MALFAGIPMGMVRMSVGLTGSLEQRLEQLMESYTAVCGHKHLPYRAAEVRALPIVLPLHHAITGALSLSLLFGSGASELLICQFQPRTWLSNSVRELDGLSNCSTCSSEVRTSKEPWLRSSRSTC